MSLRTKYLAQIQVRKAWLTAPASTLRANIFPFSIRSIKENKLHLIAVLGAITVGMLLRFPGVFWGANFPTTWYGHHVDEYTHLVNTELLLFPDRTPRWETVNPYPKGMAAHVAVPLILIRSISKDLFEKFNTVGRMITFGRVINVFYGSLTILIVYLLARKLFKKTQVAVFAAWLLAFGGLHVSQSHFFVSDVPSIFWFLMGTYFLLLDFDRKDPNQKPYFLLAAACLGVSFGLKLSFFSLPTLAILALWKSPRLSRVLEGGALFLAGFVLVNYASYTPYDIQKTLAMGMISKTQIDRLASVLIYLVELPTLVSLPVLIFFIVGFILLAKKFIGMIRETRALPIILIIFLPLVLNLYFIIFKLDNFPRHLVFYIPWIVIVTGWALFRASSYLRSKGLHPALVILPVFLYLALFVYDGERVFIQEPRNKAMNWLLENAPQGTTVSWVGHNWIPNYQDVPFPDKGRPQIIIQEMQWANYYLSGMGLKNSYPRDYRKIFAGRSQEYVDTMQALFRGQTEYKEVARFPEGYFMPEFVIVDNLIGNRSRNYIAEVVIFEKQ